MSTVSSKSWDRYINALRKLSDKATAEMESLINSIGMDSDEAVKQLINYGFALATKYGEGSASLAAEMYDALSELAGKVVAPAVPAATATYGEVAKAVYGTRLQSQKPEVMAGSIGRLVKMAGADTMQQNAIRDGAYWAWIPHGDTCAFCLTLASRGWQKASKKALKNGHAEHIHANCDCTYAIRFGDDLVIEGYDPDKYREMYDNAEGATPKDKINYMRRQFYAANKGLVGAETSKAEELLVNTIADFEKLHYKDSTESGLLLKANGERIEFSGIEHAVQGDKSILKDMEGGIFTHNHPLDNTFSSPDIVNGIVSGNLKELRAITSNGNIHILYNDGASLDDRRKFNTFYNEAQKKINRVAIERLRRGQIDSIDRYIEEQKEAWLKENAPIYNMRYEKRKAP